MSMSGILCILANGIERTVEYTGKSRFSVMVGDEKVPMRITRVASRQPARWVAYYEPEASIRFNQVEVLDNKDGARRLWRFPAFYDLSAQDRMSFYLTMADIAKLKNNGTRGEIK